MFKIKMEQESWAFCHKFGIIKTVMRMSEKNIKRREKAILVLA